MKNKKWKTVSTFPPLVQQFHNEFCFVPVLFTWSFRFVFVALVNISGNNKIVTSESRMFRLAISLEFLWKIFWNFKLTCYAICVQFSALSCIICLLCLSSFRFWESYSAVSIYLLRFCCSCFKIYSEKCCILFASNIAISFGVVFELRKQLVFS